MKRIIFLFILFCLPACTESWSATGRDGAMLQDAMPACQDKARKSVAHQFRFQAPYELYLDGSGGVPGDSRRDIYARETALCLQNKGFELHRDFK